MGIFQGKKNGSKGRDGEDHFFDQYYREELRNHGRWYFEKIIKENSLLFKEDLEATITEFKKSLNEHVVKHLDDTVAQAKNDLKDSIVRQFNQQFVEYANAMKQAQSQTLQSLVDGARLLQQEQQQISTTMQKNLAEQEVKVAGALKESVEKLAAMNQAQDQALVALQESASRLQQQQQELSEKMQNVIAEQQASMMQLFQQNMAQIIEHYVMGAIGDQYDIKAQIPGLVKQLEENKQTIVEDMQL